MSRVVVVGGGLSGLAAGYRLQQAGFEVTVLERSERTGGCAATVERDGYVADTGCNLINDSFVRYLSLVRELGLGNRVESSSPVADVVRDGRVISVDSGNKLRMARSKLLSLRAKVAVAKGAVQLYPKLRKLDAYSLTKSADVEDHGTGVDFCRKYFNDEVGDYAVDPIVRSYAGTGLVEASGLSVLGALAVGLEPSRAIRGGMRVLPDALTSQLTVLTGARVTSVADEGSGVRVKYEKDSELHTVEAEHCVLAIGYHVAQTLWSALAKAAPGLGERLQDVGLITVSLGFDAPSPTDAYALLVPTRESTELLGGFMEHNKSRDRAPRGKTLLTMCTDAAVTGRFMSKSDDDIIEWATRYAESYYPTLRGAGDFAMVTRWPHTGYIPFPGYWQAIAQTRKALPVGRVHVTSTLFGSGGIERAVLGGERAARRVVESAG